MERQDKPPEICPDCGRMRCDDPRDADYSRRMSIAHYCRQMAAKWIADAVEAEVMAHYEGSGAGMGRDDFHEVRQAYLDAAHSLVPFMDREEVIDLMMQEPKRPEGLCNCNRFDEDISLAGLTGGKSLHPQTMTVDEMIELLRTPGHDPNHKSA